MAITLQDRHRAVLDMMSRMGVDRLVCAGNGHHMIDLDNAIAHMTGYRSVGPALLIVDAGEQMRLFTSPATERDAIADLGIAEAVAAEDCATAAAGSLAGKKRTGIVGLDDMPRRLAERIEAAVQKVLAQGLRTGDIWSEGTTKVGTREMGDAVVKALG